MGDRNFRQHSQGKLCRKYLHRAWKNKGTSYVGIWRRAVKADETVCAKILRQDYARNVQKLEKGSVVEEGLMRLWWREKEVSAEQHQRAIWRGFKGFSKEFGLCCVWYWDPLQNYKQNGDLVGTLRGPLWLLFGWGDLWGSQVSVQDPAAVAWVGVVTSASICTLVAGLVLA